MAKVNLNANIDIDSKLADKIKKKITGATVTRALAAKLRPIVEEQIGIAIGGKNGAGNTNVARLLKPHIQGGDDLVGRLGVADPREPGTPDFNKLNNAWRELVPGKDTAAKFTLSIDRQNLDRLIKIKYTIDKEAFYDAKICKFIYYNDGEKITINWMKDYIEGASVEGYGFSSPTSKSFRKVAQAGNLNRVSRTGLGFLIKIPNGSFRIPPLGQDPFDAVTRSIGLKLKSSEFKAGVIKALSASLRKK